jgi:hypothetical protein
LPLDDKVNSIILRVYKTRADSKVGKGCGLKEFISGSTDFSFESEEVTGSLFNEEEVEQTVNAIKFIKYIVPSNQEWLLWINSGHIKECCTSSF